MADQVPMATSARPYPPVPPHFQAVRIMGEGSTAVTWLARYEVTDQDVALKVWRSPFLDPTDRERFVNECRWHRLLNGERGIVGWVWASEPNLEHPWTATQPHGIALTEYLRRYRITAQQAMELSLDLLDGLAAVHRRGLVHRDVNPNNVLIDDTGAALCDFGLAMPVDGVTVDRAAGTPGFVAPELDTDAPGYRSDVYSAAHTIARLLGPDVPPAVDHLVTAVAGSSRPSDRPVDAADFACRLRTLLEETRWPAPAPARDMISVSEPPLSESPGDPLPSRSRRRARGWAAWVAVPLVLVTAAAGAVLWPRWFGAHRSTDSHASSSAPGTFTGAEVASGITRTSDVTSEAGTPDVTASGAPQSPASVRPSPASPTPASPKPGRASPKPGPASPKPSPASPKPSPASPKPSPASPKPSAAAKLFPVADIGRNGEPVLGPARPVGPCDGSVRQTVGLMSADGAAVGTVMVYQEVGSALCAKFVKAQGPLWNVRTYLALTVCSTQGSCDDDWNLYKEYAGPVRVNAPGGCLHWRVSATDVSGTTWLLRDRTGSSGC